MPTPAPKGRGTGLNPPNRFEDLHLTVLTPDGEEAAREPMALAPSLITLGPEEGQDQNTDPHSGTTHATPGPAHDNHADSVPSINTRVYADTSRTIINPVNSPDLSFSWTVNPYRGCEHGCIYCYARPGHEYLSLSCGIDFETRIFAKTEAPALLRRELRSPRWRGEPIVMSGVTDPYQPVERRLRITRGCLEVFLAHRQPVSIITKNRLILRDLDLLTQLAAFNAVRCAVSLTTLDPHLAAVMEPRASSPAARLHTIRTLAGAGIPVTVMTAPIIPRINDHEIPALLEAAKEAGASSAGYILLRLPHQLRGLFTQWLQTHFPQRAAHVASLLRSAHGGDLYSADFFTRQRGKGAFAANIAALFRLHARRLGLDSPRPPMNRDAFRRDADGPMLWDSAPEPCAPS
jgi:DNA repair photolyase